MLRIPHSFSHLPVAQWNIPVKHRNQIALNSTRFQSDSTQNWNIPLYILMERAKTWFKTGVFHYFDLALTNKIPVKSMHIPLLDWNLHVENSTQFQSSSVAQWNIPLRVYERQGQSWYKSGRFHLVAFRMLCHWVEYSILLLHTLWAGSSQLME